MVFVATPLEVAISMLKLAGVRDRDLVYDLGSGDGRIVIAAAKHYGARAVGIDIDSNLVAESRRSADSAGVGERVEFRRGDLFRTDLREATVVTLYLGRTLNERLRPKLFRELRPGSRVVSQNFDMGDWAPDSVAIVRGRHFAETPVHLWVMPAQTAGTWDVRVEGASAGAERLRLVLRQRFQELGGEAHTAGGPVPIENARIRGDRVGFTLAGEGGKRRFEGTVSGDSAEGAVISGPGGERRRWQATR